MMTLSSASSSNGYNSQLHSSNQHHKIIDYDYDNNNCGTDYGDGGSGGGGGGVENHNQLHNHNQYYLQHHSTKRDNNSGLYSGHDFHMQTQYSSNGTGNCSSVIISK